MSPDLLPPWILITSAALLGCAGHVIASSSSEIGPYSNRGGRRLTQARLPWDDENSMNDEKYLTDLPTVSTVLSDEQHIPFPLRMPETFEDQPGRWTQQGLIDFEDRLRQRFGRNFQPTLLSTGTTIAGVCGYDNGQPFVVLGADTRATAGRMVADKRCSKIHCLASNMWCCGAGTSADLDQITRQCRYTMGLQYLVELESIGNTPRCWAPDEERADPNLESVARHFASMAAACRFFRSTLYKGGGNIGANLIVGGVDEGTRIPHIRAIHPHGSMDPLPYAALGSGGLAAMATIESRYHASISLQEGIQIVKDAIQSGIQNDMGSGSQVDLCVITTQESSEKGEGFQVVSNYTRAAVPEQEIPMLDKAKLTDGTPQKKATTGAYTAGVNGFGNYPFSIRSKRVVIESREAEEDNRLKKWGKAFSLEKES